MSRPPLPPFSNSTAAEKARLAEDAWSSRAVQFQARSRNRIFFSEEKKQKTFISGARG